MESYRPTTAARLQAVAVIPSDAFDLAAPGRQLWIGVAGNLAVIPIGNADNQPVTFLNVPAGRFDMVEVRRVMATGTTATSLVQSY